MIWATSGSFIARCFTASGSFREAYLAVITRLIPSEASLALGSSLMASYG